MSALPGSPGRGPADHQPTTSGLVGASRSPWGVVPTLTIEAVTVILGISNCWGVPRTTGVGVGGTGVGVTVGFGGARLNVSLAWTVKLSVATMTTSWPGVSGLPSGQAVGKLKTIV